MSREDISNYYDYTLFFYKNFWYRNAGSYGIHYGMWDEDTNSLKQALINTNKVLAAKAKVSSKDKVLDAGCGTGGSSIWLAKEHGCQVVGITISEKQIQEAKKLTKKEEVEHLVDFLFNDFTKTDFDKESFDVVWAIESVCHAEYKINFLKETYRVLKPGGRIIIADGFKMREPKSKSERKILKEFCEGLVVPALENYHNFRKLLSEAGFEKIQGWDETKRILPTSKIMHRMSSLGYPISAVTEKIGLTSPILTKNNLAGIRQYQGIRRGLMGYGLYYAEKASLLK